MCKVKMNIVEAVKDQSLIQVVSNQLEKHHGQHFADVWDLGLQLALRITDLITLEYSDIKDGYVSIREGKTGKLAQIALNPKAEAIINRRMSENPLDLYVFQSHGRNVKGIKPITRQAVANAFKHVGDNLGLKLSTHSMRKTFGYHLYKKTNNLAMVMKMLRHSSAAETLRYIGIEQADTDDMRKAFIL